MPDWVFHLAAFGAYPSQSGLGAMVETNLMGAGELSSVEKLRRLFEAFNEKRDRKTRAILNP